MTCFVDGSQKRKYAYDPNGNRTTVTGYPTFGTETFTYTGNQLTDYSNTLSTPADNLHYTFDAEGRVTDINTDHLEYDIFNNMISYNSTISGTNTYGYDSGNNRVFKDEDGVKTYYVTSGVSTLTEYNGNAEWEADYVYGLDGMLLKSDDQNGVCWFYKDQIGSTRQLDNSSQQTDHYPYGEERVTAGSETNYKFSGKELDSGIGLHYFGSRYYSSLVGRWLAPDPAGQGWSPYVYCNNSPMVYVDPNGEIAIIDDLIAIGKIAWDIYQVYQAGKTAYNMYQAYEAGGLGGLFSAAVQGGIAFGAGKVVNGYLDYMAVPGAIPGGLVGALKGGVHSGTMSWMQGGSFMDGFLDPVSLGLGAWDGGYEGYHLAGYEGKNQWTGAEYDPIEEHLNNSMGLVRNKIESGDITCHGTGCCEYYVAEATGNKPTSEMNLFSFPDFGPEELPNDRNVYQFMLADYIGGGMHTGIFYDQRTWHILKINKVNNYLRGQTWDDFQTYLPKKLYPIRFRQINLPINK